MPCQTSVLKLIFIMDYFLKSIARSLNDEFGNVLHRHCLVFPNRRAGLYFLKYLSSEISGPVWSPSIMTINELFRTFSKLKVAENELLLFELYKVYRKIKIYPESFDEFFFWGDMLINDFDDIDKYLVNAPILFTNIRDVKMIDEHFGGLAEEQIEIIRRFWINFEAKKPTPEKDGFISIWEILSQLYTEYRSSLKTQELGYEGMIFREVIENPDVSEVSLRWDQIHFIGFNALNECEKSIMKRLKQSGKARFYWDYDKSYMNPGKLNSAGFFMKDNLKIFGNDMPTDWSYDTGLSVNDPAVIRRVIDASSDVAQVKLIPSLIGDLKGLTPENACHTAIILADENLLLPLLTSIPDNIGDVNITMGFPLKQTAVYSFVRDLLDLQTNSVIRDEILYFNRKNVSLVMKNSLVTGILNGSDREVIGRIPLLNSTWIQADRFNGSERLKMIFTKPSTPSLLTAYFRNILSVIASGSANNSGDEDSSVHWRLRNEFIYRVILSLNRLETISGSPDLSFSADTWIRIFDRLLKMQTVPFSGEPLSGIQIMGILETRALDFENIIILSVNEGVLPSVSSGSSFVPFSLRQAFGLPSLNHQESIYAYHFYRLLQRSKNVTFVYNASTDGLRSGEMSRFLLQMKYEPVLSPEFLDLNFAIKTASSVNETIERTREHSDLLHKRYVTDRKILSPSAINTWLNCRMKFFFRYVNGLMEPDTISPDVDPATLGSLMHNIMNECYAPLKGTELTAGFLSTLIAGKQKLNDLIDNAFRKKFNRPEGQPPEGNELIVREVLMKYIERILSADKASAPFTITHLEESFSFIVNAGLENDIMNIRVGGKIDRIDIKDGKIRIVDYKTGNVSDNIKSIASLFIEDRKKDPDTWLQILLYCEAFLSENPGSDLYPLIYKIKRSGSGKLNGKLVIKEDKSENTVDNYNMVREPFLEGLQSLVKTIFNDQEHFSMTNEAWSKCGNCPYHSLCLK